MSNVITRIKLSLGLMAISTPFENLDETMETIIKDITLPVFSLYQPCKEFLTLNTNDLTRIDKTEQYKVYLLPEFKSRNLLYVFDVRYDDSCLSGLGYYGGGMPLMTGNIISQTLLANAGANMINQMMPKMTFKYEPPRKLYLYNLYSSSKIVLELGFEHDKSLASIPETARESFMQLASLDVKANLYPTLKMYTELNTAIGNINLKLDDWANAESARDELINKWDDSYHIDMQPMYYI
jgi:hypothetical protein